MLEKNKGLPYACGLLLTEEVLVFHRMERDPEAHEDDWKFHWTASPATPLFDDAKLLTDAAEPQTSHRV